MGKKAVRWGLAALFLAGASMFVGFVYPGGDAGFLLQMAFTIPIFFTSFKFGYHLSRGT